MEALILCVDDDEAVLDRLTELLEAAGFPVLVARTGYDALALVLSKRPALVLQVRQHQVQQHQRRAL